MTLPSSLKVRGGWVNMRHANSGAKLEILINEFMDFDINDCNSHLAGPA